MSGEPCGSRSRSFLRSLQTKTSMIFSSGSSWPPYRWSISCCLEQTLPARVVRSSRIRYSFSVIGTTWLSPASSTREMRICSWSTISGPSLMMLWAWPCARRARAFMRATISERCQGMSIASSAPSQSARARCSGVVSVPSRRTGALTRQTRRRRTRSLGWKSSRPGAITTQSYASRTRMLMASSPLSAKWTTISWNRHVSTISRCRVFDESTCSMRMVPPPRTTVPCRLAHGLVATCSPLQFLADLAEGLGPAEHLGAPGAPAHGGQDHLAAYPQNCLHRVAHQLGFTCGAIGRRGEASHTARKGEPIW
jgi:hypothetical protein